MSIPKEENGDYYYLDINSNLKPRGQKITFLNVVHDAPNEYKSLSSKNPQILCNRIIYVCKKITLIVHNLWQL